MEKVSAYPLQWPSGRPRTPPVRRKYGRFSKMHHNGRWASKANISVADALNRLQDELDRIGARFAVVSTNLETRLDGLPRSGQRAPDDPGVAVYFQLGDEPHCLPCDTYEKVEHNIAAVAAHIEATRKIERHGVASVKEMFTGFAALPPPGGAESALWWNVLGVPRDATVDDIRRAYRIKAAELHPDRPDGSEAAMAELNAARDRAIKERSAA